MTEWKIAYLTNDVMFELVAHNVQLFVFII